MKCSSRTFELRSRCFSFRSESLSSKNFLESKWEALIDCHRSVTFVREHMRYPPPINSFLKNMYSDQRLEYPIKPSVFSWAEMFPAFPSPKVEFADIGCGYGGLLIALSPLFPTTQILGMEIRQKVEEYVQKRIDALRSQNLKLEYTEAGSYQNVGVNRMNAMKFLPNFFEKHQVLLVLSNLLANQAIFPIPRSTFQKEEAQG
jgi:SAM-dependent methyltransferase